MPEEAATREVAIDLGEVRWDALDKEPPRRRFRVGRLVITCAVTLATLLAVVGAAPSSSFVLGEPLWVLTPESLENVVFGENVTVFVDGETVTGRHPRTGRDMWRLTVSGEYVYVNDTVAGIVPIVAESPSDGGGGTDPNGYTLFVVDGVTGEIIFTASGEASLPDPVGASSDGTVLVMLGPALAQGDCGDSCFELTGVDRSGTLVWRYALSEYREVVFPWQDDHFEMIAAVRPDRAVELIDARTGRVRSLAGVRVGNGESAMLSGNRLTTVASSGRHVTVVAYDLDSGEPAWRSTLEVTPSADPFVLLEPCSDDVCVRSPFEWAVLDGASGHVIASGRQSSQSVGIWLDSERLVLQGESSTTTLVTNVAVIDGRSSKVIEQFDNASIISGDPNGPVLIGRTGPDGLDLLLVEETGPARHIGVIPKDLRCRVQVTALICAEDLGRGPSRIWPLVGS